MLKFGIMTVVCCVYSCILSGMRFFLKKSMRNSLVESRKLKKKKKFHQINDEIQEKWKHPWQEMLHRGQSNISTDKCANWLQHRLHRVQAAKKVIRLHIWVYQLRTGNNITNKFNYSFVFCSDCLIGCTRPMQRNKQRDHLFEYITIRQETK